MKPDFKQVLWENFAASIDMLKDVIQICPDDLWEHDKQFFYMAYHTVIFMDYYLTYPVTDFEPQLPYTLLPFENLPPGAIDDVIPNRHYQQSEMLDYIAHIRNKCAALIGPGSTQNLEEQWIEPSAIELHGLCPSLVEEYTILEILFYNFRHVQHHVGQLNLLLRTKAGRAADWIARAGE